MLCSASRCPWEWDRGTRGRSPNRSVRRRCCPNDDPIHQVNLSMDAKIRRSTDRRPPREGSRFHCAQPPKKEEGRTMRRLVARAFRVQRGILVVIALVAISYLHPPNEAFAQPTPICGNGVVES